MSSAPKFCGNCGTPVTESSARFCGECGAPLVPPSEEPKKPPRRINPQELATEPSPRSHPDPQPQTPSHATTSDAPTSAKPTFSMSRALTTGWQTALAWLLGWLPIGVIFSNFYAQKQILNPQWYEKYPLGWDTTLVGMTIIYSSGALVGGFLAGVALYISLKKTDITLGAMAGIPVVGWAILWGTTLWLLTLPVESMSDDTLLIATPIMAIVFGALLSWPTIKALGKQHGLARDAVRIKTAAIGWGLCGFAGIFAAMIVAEFFE